MIRLLFVYGTLRPGAGHPMADFLNKRSTPLGPASIEGTLLDFGPFPGLVESRVAGDLVHGDLVELHDAATFAELDQYETDAPSEPFLFERELAEVRINDERKQAWVYWVRGNIPSRAVRIPSGCWLKHRDARGHDRDGC